ncbi:MAG: transglutaminase domain-containing protein [Planctomycetota bacterium]|nr:transglutaminase domain-containing protein [Planctomycetota bacterium]
MITACTLAISLFAGPFDVQLDIAAGNREEIFQALKEVPSDQLAGMEWLITHMPEEDLKTLSAEFLLTNCNLAYEAWRNAPWASEVPEGIFFDSILPYASVNERRDDWRKDFKERFSAVVKNAKTPSEATVLLNKQIYGMVGVKYSTDRPKADQSPYESMDAGMASCTGLSILLIDACRSAGVPARFVGTPLWYNDSGNHSWVEIYDNGWHFTGGAEPTGDKLDQGWFADSASKATKGDPEHAIFAVTWNDTDQHFPLVWLPNITTYGAIDVTDRYKEKGVSSLIPIRIVAYGNQRKRVVVQTLIFDESEKLVFEGWTNDDSADANDHLTANLVQGETYTVYLGRQARRIEVMEETVISFDQNSMSEGDADAFAQSLWKQRAAMIKTSRANEMEAKIIEQNGISMPFWHTTFGNAPFGKRSLWISMHGGGGAPQEVNTSQWENQKKLYTLEEGVYLVPRAPTDTWNLWHQSHIDPMFGRLIESMVVFEGVDPNRVYITGYSAGGDGVYQLAPRMADRFAAAGMMAGHPNETIPDGLRNLPFSLHVGGNDSAYDRNKVALEWKHKLEDLHEADPDGYEHQAVIHEGKGHWMDSQETMGLSWMAQFTRDPFPLKVVWAQDDVVHDRFYWLAVDNPSPRTTIVASIDGQTVTIHEAGEVENITVYLNDRMLDLDQDVMVRYGERVIRTKVYRDRDVIVKTLRDPGDYYTGSVEFQLH